jgi:hypothetical protein
VCLFIKYLKGTLYPWSFFKEGSYTYFWRVRGKLLLHNYIGVRSLPLLSSRCQNPPPSAPDDQCMLKFMIMFSCFTIGKAHGWETFWKCRVRVGHCLVPSTLVWLCLPPLDLTLHINLRLNETSIIGIDIHFSNWSFATLLRGVLH